MIHVEQLAKAFGRAPVLQGVSFDVACGEIVGYVGPNGAGKTTTFRILTGFLSADSGSVAVGDVDPSHDHEAVCAKIGYLAENTPAYDDMRVGEFLRFRARLKRIARAECAARVGAVLSEVDLTSRRGTMISRLSRGMRQRVGLADALLSDPPVLILDEPTTGLDPVQRRQFRKLLRSLRPSRAILFSSHEMAQIEAIADRVVVLVGGRVLATGTPKQLAAKIGGRGSLEDAFLRLADRIDVEKEEEE